MSRPLRWNPVRVEIEHLDVTATSFDPVFKNPINRKTRPTSDVYDAQVNLGMKPHEHRDRTFAGDRPFTRARVVLRTCDLAPNSNIPVPKKGDRITKLYAGTPSEQAVDYLIEEVRPESPLEGEPLLWYVEFERDREKV